MLEIAIDSAKQCMRNQCAVLVVRTEPFRSSHKKILGYKWALEYCRTLGMPRATGAQVAASEPSRAQCLLNQ